MAKNKADFLYLWLTFQSEFRQMFYRIRKDGKAPTRFAVSTESNRGKRHHGDLHIVLYYDYGMADSEPIMTHNQIPPMILGIMHDLSVRRNRSKILGNGYAVTLTFEIDELCSETSALADKLKDICCNTPDDENGALLELLAS